MTDADNNIERKIKRMSFKGSDEMHKRILGDALEVQSSVKPDIGRIIMKSKITKLAAGAVILILMLVGLQIIGSKEPQERLANIAEVLEGPLVYTLDDSSMVQLAQSATIKTYEEPNKRGFEHISGEIEVTVARGEGEFIVKTTLGEVKALGTVFKMDLITADSTEVLAVKVKEGSVEVSNAKGSTIVEEHQMTTIEKDKAPYDFTRDEKLPQRLAERIKSMQDAMEAGDGKAWVANFNTKALYDLAKGSIQYSEHRDWFSGMSKDNAENFIEAFSDVQSPEELIEILTSDIDDNEPEKIYIGSVTLADDGKHATARCVRGEKGEKRYTIYTPQWTYFDGDWWQTDD
ncbi:MAG: FecR domain-containing protein [Planctomycetota bacterium]|jgi:hypothetical protein